MSVIHCPLCDKFIDSDYIECFEWGDDDLICASCHAEQGDNQEDSDAAD